MNIVNSYNNICKIKTQNKLRKYVNSIENYKKIYQDFRKLKLNLTFLQLSLIS